MAGKTLAELFPKADHRVRYALRECGYPGSGFSASCTPEGSGWRVELGPDERRFFEVRRSAVFTGKQLQEADQDPTFDRFCTAFARAASWEMEPLLS